MLDKYIHSAAGALVKRRLNNKITARLEPCLRPESADQALAIQQALIAQMQDSTGHGVGGWKCALPFSENDADEMPVAAPVFANTIYDRSPCPVRLDEGVCKIEPEIAFRFRKDLPSRSEAYTEQEIIAALSGAHLALELIQNRYNASEEVTYLEHLADCLFNQGLYVGPEITLDEAFTASGIEFTLTDASDLSTSTTLAGKHPNEYPQLPLFWLVNFLSAQGIDIKAGQLVITSSYAGVIEVLPDREFSLQYGELGSISLRFEVS